MIKNRIQITILLVFYLILSIVAVGIFYQEVKLEDHYFILGLIPVSTIILCLCSLAYIYPTTEPKAHGLKVIYIIYGILAILYGIGIFCFGIAISQLSIPLGFIAGIPALGSIYLGILISLSHRKRYVVLEDE